MALERARELGCAAMQIFSRSPRNWKPLTFDKRDIAEFKKRRKELKIFPLIVHIPYLINLASPDERLYRISIKSFINDIKMSAQIGAEYFVTHLGSHKGRGEAFGLKRFCKALNHIVQKTRPRLRILLETTAGSGNWLGYKFEHIRYMLDHIKEKDKVGVCLDTAHIHAAGYDITTKKGFDKAFAEFDRLIGFNKLYVIHLNDSKVRQGSGVDRHEHIGKGYIGKAGMRLIVNHPKLKDSVFILETPKPDPESDSINMKVVKGLLS